MANKSHSVQLEATTQRDYKTLLSYNKDTADDDYKRNQVSQANYIQENRDQRITPTSVEAYRAAISEITKESDELSSLISKIENQISNFKSNDNDYNKKELALSKSTGLKSSAKFKTLGLVYFMTIGLILGAWLTKVLGINK
jgi:cytolysin (calcineurin-like family phosphatase)